MHRGPTGRLGLQITLDGYGGDPERLGDPGGARLARRAAGRAGDEQADPTLPGRGRRAKREGSGGITGFVLIAQSHLSVHTFPRRDFVSADIFTARITWITS